MTQPGIDAYLRLVFYEATEEYAAIFTGKAGKLPPNWRPSREDSLMLGVWAKLYERVRESDGGLEVLQEIEVQRARADRLQQQVDRLTSDLARLRPADLEMRP